jgi:hypothetical protein
VDGSNAGFVRQLKVAFGENPDYDYKNVSPETMEILPVNFATEHKTMSSHLYMIINKGYLAIPENYEKLIVSLRTAQAVSDGYWILLNPLSAGKHEIRFSGSLVDYTATGPVNFVTDTKYDLTITNPKIK